MTNALNGQVVEIIPESGKQLYARWIDTDKAQSPPGNGISHNSTGPVRSMSVSAFDMPSRKASATSSAIASGQRSHVSRLSSAIMQ